MNALGESVCFALKPQLGRVLRPCPGTRGYLCCGYWVLNVIRGCPYQCAYCVIVKDYLQGGPIVVASNIHEILEEVGGFLKGRKGIVRVGTGELGDSLALEPHLPLSEILVPYFARIPNAVLELKTKSCEVKNLLCLPHGHHTVVSFSVTPEAIAAKLEKGAPSPFMRIEAALICQQRGYPIGIHLDPVIMLPEWEEHYRSLLERVFQSLDPSCVLWVSIGGLRYPKSMHTEMVRVGLGLGEMVPGIDGKMRYLRPLRTRMFRTLVGWIRELGGPKPLIYLCMEGPDVWKDALGFAPRDRSSLDRLFQERVREYWKGLSLSC